MGIRLSFQRAMRRSAWDYDAIFRVEIVDSVAAPLIVDDEEVAENRRLMFIDDLLGSAEERARRPRISPPGSPLFDHAHAMTPEELVELSRLSRLSKD
jgi:hypothetical protein